MAFVNTLSPLDVCFLLWSVLSLVLRFSRLDLLSALESPLGVALPDSLGVTLPESLGVVLPDSPLGVVLPEESLGETLACTTGVVLGEGCILRGELDTFPALPTLGEAGLRGEVARTFLGEDGIDLLGDEGTLPCIRPLLGFFSRGGLPELSTGGDFTPLLVTSEEDLSIDSFSGLVEDILLALFMLMSELSEFCSNTGDFVRSKATYSVLPSFRIDRKLLSESHFVSGLSGLEFGIGNFLPDDVLFTGFSTFVCDLSLKLSLEENDFSLKFCLITGICF